MNNKQSLDRSICVVRVLRVILVQLITGHLINNYNIKSVETQVYIAISRVCMQLWQLFLDDRQIMKAVFQIGQQYQIQVILGGTLLVYSRIYTQHKKPFLCRLQFKFLVAASFSGKEISVEVLLPSLSRSECGPVKLVYDDACFQPTLVWLSQKF